MSKAASRPAAAERKSGFRFPRTRQEWTAEGIDWLRSIVVVLVIFIPLVTFVVQGFRIPSGSMEDTLLVGDFLFADKITFGARVPFTEEARLPGLRDPEAGDIVIFKSPVTGENLIKRVIAVAGQRVEMRRKVLYIDGQPLQEPFVKHIRSNYDPRVDDFGPIRVPAEHIFCLGDNRDASHDSRFYGPVPLRLVIAKADILYFSFNTDKLLPRVRRIGRLL